MERSQLIYLKLKTKDMGKYSVSYTVEKIVDNIQIEPIGFSSIEFLLIGDDTAKIFNNIPLNSDQRSFEFINRPNEIISVNIPVTFDGVGSVKEIVVIKAFYEQIT